MASRGPFDSDVEPGIGSHRRFEPLKRGITDKPSEVLAELAMAERLVREAEGFASRWPPEADKYGYHAALARAQEAVKWWSNHYNRCVHLECVDAIRAAAAVEGIKIPRMPFQPALPFKG